MHRRDSTMKTQLDVPKAATTVDAPAAATFPLPADGATLTVLTGPQTGWLVSIGPEGIVVGQSKDAGLVVSDPGVSPLHARIAPTGDALFYVEDLGSAEGTFVGERQVGLALLDSGDTLQLGPAFQLRFATIDRVEEPPFAAASALADLLNRRDFIDRLSYGVSTSWRASLPLSVLMIGIDRWTELNTRVSVTSRAIGRSPRSSRPRFGEPWARTRSGKFEATSSPSSRARRIALARCFLPEEVRVAVASLRAGVRGQLLPLTVCVGLASLAEIGPGGDAAAALLALADRRLQSAQSDAQNRVHSG